MREEIEVSNHLVRNLERISPDNSIFNYKSGRNAFLSLGQGNIREWLEIFLPNTRIILEPKIIGSIIGIQYINGELNKVINKNSQDITESVRSLKTIPKSLAIKNRLEIQGVLYDNKNLSTRICLYGYKPTFRKLDLHPVPIAQCPFQHFQLSRVCQRLDGNIGQLVL